MYATLTSDGIYTEHDGKPSLERMQEFVADPSGTYSMVEVMELRHEIDMWFNEEGKYAGENGGPMPRNERATMMAQAFPGLFPHDFIAGDCLFTGHDDMGETVGLNSEQADYVRAACQVQEIGRPGSGVWNMTGVSL